MIEKLSVRMIFLIALMITALFSVSCAQLGDDPAPFKYDQPTDNLPPLTVVPENPRVIQGQNRRFHGQGGYPGANGYRYSLSGLSGAIPPGSIDPVSGLYTAPTNVDPNNSVAFVIVTDGLGQTVSTTVLTIVELQITPASNTVTAGQKANFDVIGGQAPFTWCVIDTDTGDCVPNANVGDITDTGLFNSHSLSGSSVVQVEDVSGNKAQSVIVVKPIPELGPSGISVPYGWQLQMVVIGGSPPFTYYVDEATGNAGGSISADGIFTAPQSPIVSTIETRDDYSYSSKVNIFIVNPNRISSGDNFNCLLFADSQGVKCWGDDTNYQTGYWQSFVNDGIVGTNLILGDEPNEVGARVPIHRLNGGSFVTSKVLRSGNNHSCVIDAANNVRCWGVNTYGQLGIANSSVDTAANTNSTPVTFCTDGTAANCAGTSTSGTTAVTAALLATGSNHTCATNYNDDPQQTSRTLFCWGRNNLGQTAIGSTLDYKRPRSFASDQITFSGSPKIIDLKAGEAHTCALLEGSATFNSNTNQLICWGDNSKGQLGVNSTVAPNDKIGESSADRTDIANRTKPVVFTNPGPKLPSGATLMPIAIGLGKYHTCALLNDESIRCWGDNSKGQLGKGTGVVLANDDAPATIGIDFGGGVPVSIRVGYDKTCAIFLGGILKCIGDNLSGSLGIEQPAGIIIGDSSAELGSAMLETKPDLLGFVTDATIGKEHICAVMNDNRVKCWGRNDKGQLGINSTTSQIGELINTMGQFLSNVGFF